MSKEGVMVKSKIKNQKSKLQIKIKNFKHFNYFFIFILSSGLIFAGCAGFKDAAVEGAKGIAGISTRVLEDNRKSAIKKTFNYNSDICYNESKRMLKNMDCYIYAQDPQKKMIAVYITELDTTPVGVFFKVVDDNSAQVEVSSPSTFGKEFVSKRLFAGLENLSKRGEELEKGTGDAEDDVENM